MDDPDALELARAQWRWRGKDRPALTFAESAADSFAVVIFASMALISLGQL